MPLARESTAQPIASIQVQVLRDGDGGVRLVDGLQAEWQALSAESAGSGPFLRPEWIRAYLHAFAASKSVVVLTARVQGRLRAVLPLVESQRTHWGNSYRVLEGAANVHSCRFDILHAEGEEGVAAAEAIWRELQAMPDWTALEFHFVPVEGTLSRMAGSASKFGCSVATEESLASPYFSLAGGEKDWDRWLQKLDGDFRRELRRRARKLAELGEVRLERITDADPARLQAFYELESSGWKGKEATAILSKPETKQFYQEVAEAAARLGYLSLYFLTLKGRTIAAHLGLSVCGTYFVPKLAYDEEFHSYAPGQLLLNAVASDCASRGLTEFDFLGPNMDWKAQWTSRTRKHQSLFIFRGTFPGRFLYFVRFGMKKAAKSILGWESARQTR